MVSAAFLFIIKHKVYDLRKELKAVNNQILKEKENIHVLKAEYTYLSSPKRIRKLSNTHLDLQTVKPEQIIDRNSVAKFIKPLKTDNKGAG